MRLIGILMVLLFALQPQFAEGRSQVVASNARTCIERVRLAGSLLAAASTGERDEAVWASGMDLPGRYRQYRNPLRRLKRVGLASRRRAHQKARPVAPVIQAELAEPVAGSTVERCQPSAEVEARGKKRGKPATTATGHVCCIVQGCRGYGKFGSHPDHWIVGAGLYHTIHNGSLQMYQCQWCKKRFSETQGTAFFDLKTPTKTVCQALTALSEGVSLRGTARIVGEKPETILLWLRRAGQHSQQVSDYLLKNLHVSQAQMDELWTFVRKKEKNLSTWEQLRTEYGDTWVWVVFDPVNKLVLSLLVGEREEDQAVGVLNQLKACLAAGCLPLFTSDQLPQYLQALLRVFGRWIQPQRQGVRGRFPNPRLEAPDDLLYATVHKHKQNGRVTSVTTEVVLGDPATIAHQLEAIRPGLKINTSFIERFNLTLRHLVSRLRRKGLTFSKKRKYLVWHLQLATAYYHFVRPHGSLRQRLDEPCPTRGSPKLWQPRTPTMSAGLTDHPWSMQELLSFRVPPPIAA
jgi:IS1 family transposase